MVVRWVFSRVEVVFSAVCLFIEVRVGFIWFRVSKGGLKLGRVGYGGVW